MVQGALLRGAARIFAVDVAPDKLEHARNLGATDAVDASSVDPVEAVRELTGGHGVEFAFSAIGPPIGLVQAIRMCAYAGTATLVGMPVPDTKLDVDLFADVFSPKPTIAVTHGGDTIPREDFPFLAQAALDGRIDLARFVTSTISLDEVPERLAAHRRARRDQDRGPSLAEALPPRQVDLLVHEVTVALDVAALAADDEDDRVLVARVRDAPRSGRARVEEPALAELARLAVDVDPDAAPVHEVELVLRVVVVLGPLVVRRIDDRVDAERLDAERLPDLAEAVALAELVEGGERVASRGARLRRVRERQTPEELGELLALLRREPRAEQLLDVGEM